MHTIVIVILFDVDDFAFVLQLIETCVRATTNAHLLTHHLANIRMLCDVMCERVSDYVEVIIAHYLYQSS